MSVKIVFTVLCASCLAFSSGDTSYSQDSYASALQNSHQTDFGDTSGSGYDYSPPSNTNYLPPDPKPVYGPPAPTPVYGPPAPIYGPPHSFYKPPPSIAFHPRDHWFLEKLKTKINLFTIGKIILKLLIFKKIVKFIGVICLLLFLPKLKGMFKDDANAEEDGMESKQVETETDILEQRLEEVYNKFIRSLTAYEATDK